MKKHQITVDTPRTFKVIDFDNFNDAVKIAVKYKEIRKMATLRQNAQDMLDVAREGIGWIALWKDGKGWMTMDFWPDIDRSGRLIFEGYEIEWLRNISTLDPRAILVNGWEHNLGDATVMTRDSLAAALRWQYNLQHYQVADVLNCGAHV